MSDEAHEAFWAWRDSLNDRQEALLSKLAHLADEPIEALGIAFSAGYEAAKNNVKREEERE